MIRYEKSFLVALFLSAFFVFSFTPIAFSADTLLSVPERIQEHDQWCWDASSQAVLEYYGPVVAQCDIANWAWGRNDCCGNGTFEWTNTACNWWNYMSGPNNGHDVPGGSLQGILTNWGVTSNLVNSALSQTTCVAEINAGKPFVIRFGWPGGGGHFLVGYGYEQDGQFLNYMDPWPGNGYTRTPYTLVVNEPGDHIWTHSLRSTTNPRPTVTTGATASISASNATLNGTVNAYSSLTTVTFEYGTTTSYGNTVIADQSPVTGSTTTAVSKAITGLAPNTRYHYRVKAESSAGTSYGSDMTFTNINLVPVINLLLD